MAISDPSREDAAADAGSVLRVDDHGVARDAALVGVGAEGERDSSDLQARVVVRRRGFALVGAGVSGAVCRRPRVRCDAARRHGAFEVVAALVGGGAISSGVDVEAAGDAVLEALQRAGEDDAVAVLADARRAVDLEGSSDVPDGELICSRFQLFAGRRAGLNRA